MNSDGSQTTVIHLPHILAEVEEETRGFVEDPVQQPDYSGLDIISGEVLFITFSCKPLGEKKTAAVDTVSDIARASSRQGGSLQMSGKK